MTKQPQHQHQSPFFYTLNSQSTARHPLPALFSFSRTSKWRQPCCSIIGFEITGPLYVTRLQNHTSILQLSAAATRHLS